MLLQFYISDPKLAAKPRATSPEDKQDYEAYWENVKAVHQVRVIHIKSRPLASSPISAAVQSPFPRIFSG